MAMRSLRRLGLFIVYTWFSALSATASSSVCSADGLQVGSVANQPFTADVRMASWVIDNGNRDLMKSDGITKVARDSSGRVMTIFPQAWASDEDRESGGPPLRWQTMICDPLAGLITTMYATRIITANPDGTTTDSGRVNARVEIRHGFPRRTTSDQNSYNGLHMSENYEVEDMGLVTVEGITAHRFRSWLKSDGLPSGKDVRYVEEAFLKSLELVVTRIEVISMSNAKGAEYIRLNPGEPKRELFLIPPNYTITSMHEIPAVK